MLARSSAPLGFSSEPLCILQLGFGLFSTEWTLWSSLVARSCCSALTFASLVAAAAVAEGLLCFLAAEVVGGRSISVLERINPFCSGGEESLSPGGEVVEQV